MNALDKAWEEINALGGYVGPRDVCGTAYNKAVHDALAIIEKLGGKSGGPDGVIRDLKNDPLPVEVTPLQI